MPQAVTLEGFLRDWTGGDGARSSVRLTLLRIAEGVRAISELVAQGNLAGELGAITAASSHGDEQKHLDVRANDMLVAALSEAPVGVIASEELALPITCDSRGPLAVALDPLDGSSNIDNNVAVGTIFSLLPALGSGAGDGGRSFLQPGSQQCAAGYAIYGPQCAIVLTIGAGTQVFTLDRTSGEFALSCPAATVPQRSREYAINASNERHWSRTVKAYVEDCVSGGDGPRGQDFNMRWIASLVAECHRILMRGGVFLYPRDARKGYEHGRIRLVYEANPIAFLIEQAGGKATNGIERILELRPAKLHQRTPLVFGSSEEVDLILRYETEREPSRHGMPLFNERGLFRV
jgi:fructose-1,6-bisphosphatase I